MSASRSMAINIRAQCSRFRPFPAVSASVRRRSGACCVVVLCDSLACATRRTSTRRRSNQGSRVEECRRVGRPGARSMHVSADRPNQLIRPISTHDTHHTEAPKPTRPILAMDNENPIFNYIQHGNLGAVQQYVLADPVVLEERLATSGGTPLMWAAEHGWISIASWIHRAPRAAQPQHARSPWMDCFAPRLRSRRTTDRAGAGGSRR